MPARIQTRRSITLAVETYDALKRAAAARGVAMSTVVEEALGDFTGPEIKAAAAHTLAAGRRKSGPKSKAAPRYVAVAPPREVRRYPSLERRMLGDGVANALGYR